MSVSDEHSWAAAGIADSGTISRLLINEVSQSIVAVLDTNVAPDWCVKRLYHRRFDETSYRRVEPTSMFEGEEDAESAHGAPFVIFLSRPWERSTNGSTEGWFAMSAALCRLDLRTGQRELVLKEQDLRVSIPNIRTMLQGFHAVRADGLGGIVTLGLERKVGSGPETTVDYGLFSLDFETGEATKLTSLPHTFL